MKSYCRSEDTCQRKLLLDYFGFSRIQQENSCCICSKQLRIYPNLLEARSDLYLTTTVLSLKGSSRAQFLNINQILNFWTSDCSVLFHISVDNNLATKVMEGVEFMESVGIWNEACSSQNFSLASEHTTTCTTERDSDDDQIININCSSRLCLSTLLMTCRIEMNSEH